MLAGGDPPHEQRFPMRAARSGAVIAGVSIAIAVETLALHLLLRAHHPFAGWTSTTISVASLAWLVADYRKIAERPLLLTDSRLVVAYGLRVRAEIPLNDIAVASQPTWREIPPRSRDYLRLSGFDDPNVLLRFRAPMRFRGPGGLSRSVTRLGLRLDEPGAFMSALRSAGVNDDRS